MPVYSAILSETRRNLVKMGFIGWHDVLNSWHLLADVFLLEKRLPVNLNGDKRFQNGHLGRYII